MKITFRKARKPKSGGYSLLPTVNVRVDGQSIGVLQEGPEKMWRIWVLVPDPSEGGGNCWSMVNGSFASEQDARAMILKVIAADVSRAGFEP